MVRTDYFLLRIACTFRRKTDRALLVVLFVVKKKNVLMRALGANNPIDIVRDALEYAKENNHDYIISLLCQ